MTKTERRMCFQHAKKHVIDAIREAMADEHHSVMELDGKPRGDMQNRTEWDMDLFLRQVKRIKFEDWVKI